MALGLAREKLGVARDRAMLNTEALDLNAMSDLGRDQYDLIVVFYFLRRELFPALVSALKPGGILIYRTYTIDRMNVRDPAIRPIFFSRMSCERHSLTLEFSITAKRRPVSCGRVGGEEGVTLVQPE